MVPINVFDTLRSSLPLSVCVFVELKSSFDEPYWIGQSTWYEAYCHSYNIGTKKTSKIINMQNKDWYYYYYPYNIIEFNMQLRTRGGCWNDMRQRHGKIGR